MTLQPLSRLDRLADDVVPGQGEQGLSVECLDERRDESGSLLGVCVEGRGQRCGEEREDGVGIENPPRKLFACKVLQWLGLVSLRKC